MKKSRLAAFAASFLILTASAFADVNFSGIAGGTLGLTGTFGDPEVLVPFNTFAAAQLNLGSWGIFRANMELATKNLASENTFKGQDATIKMNEISLVLMKNAATVKNYFGFYMGTYEAVGQDEFIQRQFGLTPYTSLITKNASTLATGFPLFSNEGIGANYTMNFSKAPGALGFNLYFNIEDSIANINFDVRTAWITKLMTVDLCAGIHAPMENKYQDTQVALLIDTLYTHGGINILFGNNYSHALLIEAGVQNLPTSSKPGVKTFNEKQDISFLVEPRIYTKNVKVRLTGYSIPQERINEMLYLRDPVGGVVTVFTDAIPVKSNNMTAGIHLIASAENQSLLSLLKEPEMSEFKLNTFVTPYIEMPLSSGTFEVMTQIGICNILDKINVNFQVKAGYKRVF